MNERPFTRALPLLPLGLLLYCIALHRIGYERIGKEQERNIIVDTKCKHQIKICHRFKSRNSFLKTELLS